MRSLAIGLVLVSHCGAVFARWYGLVLPQYVANCGTFGVEIFFVLSGYLVGRILLQTPPTTSAFRRFMTRRWLRTLPLYYLALAVLFWIWPPSFWMPDHWRIMMHAIPEYALFLQNFAWTMGHDNWFGASWSLTVEEWFYVGFSAMLLGLTNRFNRNVALCLSACVFMIGPAIVRGLAPPLYSAPHSVVTAVDQICIGVIMAWVSMAAPARFVGMARLLPVGVALCTLFWFEQRWIAAPIRQALWTDVLAGGIALCLPAAAAWQNASGAIAIAMRAISLRSYGLYIVHLPVLELASYYRGGLHAPIWSEIAATAGAIWLLPVLTWRYIERPLLRKGCAGESTSLVTAHP